MTARDQKLLLIGLVLVLVLSGGTSGGSDGALFGGTSKTKAKPTAKKKTAPILDVTGPKMRPATPAEKAAAAAQYGPPRPPATVSASPELELRHGRTPAGYQPASARAQAQEVAAHLTTKGPRAYERGKLMAWQKLAGIRADGSYGGSTRGALVFYGALKAPRPFVAPYATLPYHRPDQ